MRRHQKGDGSVEQNTTYSLIISKDLITLIKY